MEMVRTMDKLPKIFLSCGHANGARTGARYKNIIEEDYNLAIIDSLVETFTARISLENLINKLPPIIYDGLIATDLYSPIPYELLIAQDNKENPLYGTYSQRQKKAKELGVDVIIQMHLNSAKGNYGVVGFSRDKRKLIEKNEKIAHIFAKVMDEELVPINILKAGKNTPAVQVWNCNSESTGAARRVNNCIRTSEVPTVLIELMFLDNEVHNLFLDSEEGLRISTRVYIKALERIAKEVGSWK